MKTKIQHILLGGTIAVVMAITNSAQAHVEITAVRTTMYSAPAALTEVVLPAESAIANQPVIQFAQKKISASKAKKIARSRVRGGEVVDVSLRGSTYKVRVIAKNGRVVDVLIDANTGRVK